MLLGPVEINNLLKQLDIRPTKKLGQNFLHDANIVRKIVKSAQLNQSDVVLEVGPGLGSLTLGLLPEVQKVIAVDIDERFTRQLPATVSQFASEYQQRILVLHKDALELTQEDLPLSPTALVANLPYNISVPVLITVLTRFPSISKFLVMVQAEVADRLAAKPGDAAYGAPSVKLQWFMRVTRGADIPRPVFIPVPNVDSGLVFGTRREPPSSAISREKVFKVIDAAFNQRRKMLRSALGAIAGSASAAEMAITRAGINPTIRGEMLQIEQFVRLAEELN